ncbi:MAG TPA: LacI family DNA-binding transcriptional regulator [Bacillota bacterium]
MIVTIRDVAKNSGFSVTTVSHALNGYSDVSSETRQKIMEVAAELKYMPNRAAKSLVSKESHTIGVFILERMTLKHPFVFDVLSGIMDEAGEEYDVLLVGTQKINSISDLHRLCAQRGVGGAVLMGLRIGNPILQEMESDSFPVMLIDIPVLGKRAAYVSSDNQCGAKQALEYLYKLGHRNIAFINGHEEAMVSKERLLGYEKTLAEYDLAIKDTYVFHGDFSKESAKLGVRALMERNSEITAIFAASDLMATGAIEELNAMGLKVPGDVSIIGFDDQDFSVHTSPPLSTIRQKKYDFGRMAIQEMIAMFHDQDYQPAVHKLDTDLIIRDSTGPARSSGR